MEGPIIGYMRISDDPLAQSHGVNLDPICAPNLSFLNLQELFDFPETWDLCYFIFQRMLRLQKFWFLAIFLVFRQ